MQAFFICQRNRQQKTQQRLGFLFIKCNYWLLPLITFNKRLKLVFTSQKLNLVYALSEHGIRYDLSINRKESFLPLLYRRLKYGYSFCAFYLKYEPQLRDHFLAQLGTLYLVKYQGLSLAFRLRLLSPCLA